MCSESILSGQLFKYTYISTPSVFILDTKKCKDGNFTRQTFEGTELKLGMVQNYTMEIVWARFYLVTPL